ncbi:hypothetical protein [Rhodospirillum sp. A1_3_36]|uniref:hypothetical protein n=1 Tax=Rhodospirillum sp. A1_3_36 TaxID=3391666 RepID=UPI0039A76C0C
MNKHTFDQNKQRAPGILDDRPMGFSMPPEVILLMNAPEVVALATTVQLATPVIAIALAARRWLTRETPRSRDQTPDVEPPQAEIVENPDEIVVRFRGREARLSHQAADKIFELFQRLDPHTGAPGSFNNPEEPEPW